MNERNSGVLLSYLNLFLQTIAGVLYVPLLLGYMGKEEYGLFQLMGALVAYLGIMDFGLSTVIVRFYSEYKAKNDHNGMENILALSSFGYGIISCLVAIVGYIIYLHLGDFFANSLTSLEIESAKKIFLVLLLNIIITLTTVLFRAVINANEKYAFLKGTETIQIIIQPFVILAVMQTMPTAYAMVIIQTVINILFVLLRMFYCYKKLHIVIKFHYIERRLLKEIYQLGSSIFFVALIDQFFWRTNQVILGVIAGTSAVATYSIAAIIYMNYMSIGNAISGVFLPKVSRMVAENIDGNKLSELFIRIGRVQYLILSLTLTGFIIFGKEFINLWAGTSFLSAYWITIIILVPFTIDLIQGIGLCILQAKNQYGFRAKVFVCIGIINLVLVIPLAIKFGGIGCAIGSSIALFLGNGCIMNWYYLKIVKLNIKKFWREIGKITLPVVCCLFLGSSIFQIFTGSLTALLFNIVGYTILYIFIMWRYAFNAEEKQLINGTIINLKMKIKKVGE